MQRWLVGVLLCSTAGGAAPRDGEASGAAGGGSKCDSAAAAGGAFGGLGGLSLTVGGALGTLGGVLGLATPAAQPKPPPHKWGTTSVVKRKRRSAEAKPPPPPTKPAAAAKPSTLTEKVLRHTVGELVVPGYKEPWKAVLASPEIQKRVAWSEETFTQLRPSPDDAVGSICFLSAFFKDSAFGFNLPTDENVDAYVTACREVFHSMPTEVQERLHAQRRNGTLAQRLNIFNNFWSGWPKIDAETCGAAWPRKEYRELGVDAEEYRKSGIRPLREQTIELSEIRGAFSRAEVARFDGRALLPQSMFNKTLQDLDAMHPDAGEAIPEIPVNTGEVFGNQNHCHSAILRLINRFPRFAESPEPVPMEVVQAAMRGLLPWLLQKECAPSRTHAPPLAEVARRSKRWDKVPLAWGLLGPTDPAVSQRFRDLQEKGQTLVCADINWRRVPRFGGGVDVVQKLGLQDDVENTHSFIWLGATDGQFHPDKQDNIYVQLTGESDMFLFPPNCTSLIDTGNDAIIGSIMDAGMTRWQTHGQPRGRMRAPFFHMKLKPGDGVVIPSGAQHRVRSTTPERLALNVWFEPKFGKMLWPSTPANMYVRATRDALAMRALWSRSNGRLWETKKISYAYSCPRLELI